MKINIDITDWNEEYQQSKPDVSSEDEIINRAKEGVKPSEMARNVIAARENGDAPENIIKNNKLLLKGGAALSINQMMARRHTEATLKNGKKVNPRALTCATEGATIDAVVDSDTKIGVQNAINYLHNTIPGYIYSRLIIIANGGEDVNIHIDKMVEYLENLREELT